MFEWCEEQNRKALARIVDAQACCTLVHMTWHAPELLRDGQPPQEYKKQLECQVALEKEEVQSLLHEVGLSVCKLGTRVLASSAIAKSGFVAEGRDQGVHRAEGSLHFRWLNLATCASEMSGRYSNRPGVAEQAAIVSRCP